ncbi:MAG: UDP-3-O-(3-hydroxymyristoyl)glucosamine N-acyltransferase [Cycloclasticus sp.]|nr:MAG: UDP-3-O-(3-hydroxymyristoyl)glucosamine N-acyltransferase [Cycloclasticus sp.]
MNITLGELSDLLGAEIHGDSTRVVKGCATLSNANSNQLSFIYNTKYIPALSNTKAGVVILSEPFLVDCPVNALVVNNPYLSYAKAATIITSVEAQNGSIHSSVTIGSNAAIAESCVISPNVCIGDNVTIEEGCVIGPGCVIQNDVFIGRHSNLVANVTLGSSTVIGQHFIANSGAVIGSDGFGYAPETESKAWFKIPQLGKVVIGDNVEVGANTTIDRGALDDTVISNGVKIDNQVMIAHNVCIGEHTAIAGCVGIAGSAIIGSHCTLAGGVGLVGHITIADGVHITGMTMVTHSIKEAGAYSSGTPFQKNSDWLKNAVRFKQLDKLTKKINNLIKSQKES